MSTYPSNLPVFPTLTDEVDVVAANDENSARNEIIALCTYIGTNPHGSKSDLTTRIAQMMATNGALAQGVSFPTNPVEGQEFWRTDLKTLYVYNSTSSIWASQGQSLSNYLGGLTATLSQTFPSGFGVFTTCYLGRLYKISGISTAIFNVFCSSSSGNLYFAGSIGSLSGSNHISTSSFVWGSVPLDISSLGNGTFYDIVVQCLSDAIGSVRSVQIIGQ